MGFSETNSRIKRPISGEFRGKIRVKFRRKTIVKKKLISLESDRFCAHFTNVFNETRRQFCQFLVRGEMMSISQCNNNNNRNAFLKPGDVVLKTPACYAMLFGLGILSHRFFFFFFLSEIIICSFNNNELRNVPLAKRFISCTSQCQFFAIII